MKQYIVKDSYLKRIYLTYAENAKKACSNMYHSVWSVEDSKLKDFTAIPLDEYIKESENQGYSIIEL